jgi:hypothetical protein
VKILSLLGNNILSSHGIIYFNRPFRHHSSVFLVVAMDLGAKSCIRLTVMSHTLMNPVTSISYPRSNFGAFRSLTLPMKTFCKGKIPEVAFSISFPITSGITFDTRSFKSQELAWFAMIPTIWHRIMNHHSVVGLVAADLGVRPLSPSCREERRDRSMDG